MSLSRKALSFVVSLVAASACLGNELDESTRNFFESRIRPVLVEHCYECHSASAKQLRAGLLLDGREALRAGGESGPVIVPGDPDESLLIQALRHESFEMPPDQKLADSVIRDFEQWVRMGAPDPRESTAPPPVDSAKAVNLEQGRQFWSFQPVGKCQPPSVADATWPLDASDAFVLHELEQARLTPSDSADRYTLARRLYFDLIGLPPTEWQVREFVDDDSPDAMDRVVDRLLSQPEFGQRWGRHWLDVVRFAESSGGGRSLMFKNAWRFRDYVIAAWNLDKPYDQFVMEQIAGDLLPACDDLETRQHRLTATGFLALGAINYELQDKELLRMEIIDEQLDAIGRALLGMTVSCARCHDHKFDPIPTYDYYAMAGIFRSTLSVLPGNVSGYVERPLPLPSEEQRAYERLRDRLTELKENIAKWKSSGEEPDRLRAANHELEQLTAEAAQRPVVMSVDEHEEIGDYFICVRGNAHNLGPQIPRGVLQVCQPEEEEFHIEDGQSGRMELARWLVSPENPLTARVFVNRLWHYLFGQGLVRTVDNFGATGELPSHPALLDFLAARLRSDGWSAKRSIRGMVRSRVYAQSSKATERATRMDPENRLLSHASRRRLEAEAMRDSMLAVSGQLDLTSGGLTIRKFTQYDLGYEFQTVRRGVYVPWFRNTRLDLFEAFDAPNPNVATGRRNVSTLPTQALLMMNSPFVGEQAAAAAKRLLDTGPRTHDERVLAAYLSVLGRPPTIEEQRLVTDYVAGMPDDEPLQAWSGVYHLLFASLDFRYLD